ncbi:hypothetical protein SteCoe_31506 [Stentor coeruleus]|uniref:NADH dehydrogenase [ubiquinone] 1 beta subcomplex subunit 7 n=1 Tax=Stentor coeruleus TaxID=5963 RepID=A0A1R2B167_9CILI|nr:hypothetical protein SteCoe_31506 [Stentor coeruleus]
MAHHAKDHSSHEVSHGHDSHDSHDHHHHETRHFSDFERLLHGIPKNAWNRCTDSFLDYTTCVKKHAQGGWPLQYLLSVYWADRWTCVDENHNLRECEMQRTLDIFEQNKDEIASRS